MARPKKSVPSYLLHRPSGRARVRIGGRDVYLGRHNSPESLEEYRRLLTEHFENPACPDPVIAQGIEEPWTVAQLAVKYDEFAKVHYVKDGEPTDERYRAVIPPLVRLYGSTPVRSFGPKSQPCEGVK